MPERSRIGCQTEKAILVLRAKKSGSENRSRFGSIRSEPADEKKEE